jgi:hypothetical protein
MKEPVFQLFLYLLKMGLPAFGIFYKHSASFQWQKIETVYKYFYVIM